MDALISQIYFRNKTLNVSDSSSVHHQEFFTVHTAMVYVIQNRQKNCPKHVEFKSKNKLEQFVHLVGLIVGILGTVRVFR